MAERLHWMERREAKAVRRLDEHDRELQPDKDELWGAAGTHQHGDDDEDAGQRCDLHAREIADPHNAVRPRDPWQDCGEDEKRREDGEENDSQALYAPLLRGRDYTLESYQIYGKLRSSQAAASRLRASTG